MRARGRRRARSASAPVTCETDRARFLGRGRSTRDPVALETDGPLSGTTGAVLDPIFALRTRVRLEPRAVGVGGVHHARRHHPRARLRAGRPLPRSARRAARARPRVDLEPGGAARAGHHARRRRACSRSWPAISSTATRRSGRRRPSCAGTAARSRCSGPSASRATGRSCSPRSTRPRACPTLRQLLAAHHYWRRRGMMVDLVVLNAHPPSYLPGPGRPDHRRGLRPWPTAASLDRPGGVFVRRRDLLAPTSCSMLRATARVHIACDGRPLGRILATAMTTRTCRRMTTFDPPPAPRSAGARAERLAGDPARCA